MIEDLSNKEQLIYGKQKFRILAEIGK